MSDQQSPERAANSNPPNTRPTPNGLEQLVISSGSAVFIDQFMLANPQFVDVCGTSGDRSKLEEALRRYGGSMVNLPNGEYLVYRDPMAKLIVLTPKDQPIADPDEGGERGERTRGPALQDYVDSRKQEWEPISNVHIDTRCLVTLDAALVADQELMGEYRKFRSANDSKSARDLLRSRGAAVRYGFNHLGDELGVFRSSTDNVVALWPDIAE